MGAILGVIMFSGLAVLFFWLWKVGRRDEKAKGEVGRHPSWAGLMIFVFALIAAIACFLEMIGKLDVFLAYLDYMRTH